ncbi:CFF_collapsed_G0026310.mRNA.1.CDS.1 [Saccharomyces cerevisiae]|nr:CFF_collapsed_G0026310.mRNA.1.CDS.1 [Saccharomyces cerevisiae]
MDSSPNKKTYRYPRRSLSLHARDRASEARKLEELNLNDGLVAAGLQLVGVALSTQPNYQSSPVLSSVSSSPKLFPRLSSESLDNSIQLVPEVVNLPQLPPPPPPPLPQSLLTDAESTLKPDNVPSITAPAPPPLPDLFKNESCFAIPPPPPPPPLPESLSMNKESSNNDLVTPPAPPLPNGLLPSSSVSINSTTVNLKATSSEKRLKQIHWDKVEDIKDTLWEDTFQRQETIKELQTDGIFSQIEDTFRMKSPD